MRRLLLTAAVLCASLSGLTACKGACRELSEKLCECALNSVEKQNCQQRARDEESRVEPTAENEAVCEERIAGCDCRVIETEEGKKACGLAR
jgi:hypothetical protein